MPSTILFIHGFWESPEVFKPVADILAKDGLKVDITYRSPSLGTTSPGNPSMKDDIAAVHKHIEQLADGGDDIVLVLHSAGGFIGSNGAQGLLAKDRKTGGVSKIVFISGAVFPVGFTHGDLPFAKAEGGNLLVADPEQLLFNDLEAAEATQWVKKMEKQPSEGWNDTVTYAAWQDVPSVYIVCTKDAVLPVPLQEQLAGAANSQVERVDGGHMAMLSRPADIARIIEAAAA